MISTTLWFFQPGSQSAGGHVSSLPPSPSVGEQEAGPHMLTKDRGLNTRIPLRKKFFTCTNCNEESHKNLKSGLVRRLLLPTTRVNPSGYFSSFVLIGNGGMQHQLSFLPHSQRGKFHPKI